MKSTIAAGAIFVFFFAAVGFSVPMTQIWYQADELGAGRWQYTYDVSNFSLPGPIEQFTIYFEYGDDVQPLYDDLAVETPDPPAGDWSEIVLQPEPVLSDDGLYDALALYTGIAQGQTVSGFKVSFVWRGTGEPGSQLYEIIDPQTFETIDSGQTIPEPAALLLLGLGAMALRRKSWPQKNRQIKIA